MPYNLGSEAIKPVLVLFSLPLMHLDSIRTVYEVVLN